MNTDNILIIVIGVCFIALFGFVSSCERATKTEYYKTEQMKISCEEKHLPDKEKE